MTKNVAETAIKYTTYSFCNVKFAKMESHLNNDYSINFDPDWYFDLMICWKFKQHS